MFFHVVLDFHYVFGKPIAADPPADALDRAFAFRSAPAKLTHFTYNNNLHIKNYVRVFLF